MAAGFNAGISNLTDDQLIEASSGLVYPILGMSQVLSVTPTKGADDSELTLEVEGLLTTLIKYDGSRGEQRFNLPGSNIAFAPDRARRQWHEIPVQMGQPNATVIVSRSSSSWAERARWTPARVSSISFAPVRTKPAPSPGR